MVAVHLGMDFRNVKVRILDTFAAFNESGADRPDSKPVGEGRKVTLDGLGKCGLGGGERFVQHHQNFRHTGRIGQHGFEQRIGRPNTPRVK